MPITVKTENLQQIELEDLIDLLEVLGWKAFQSKKQNKCYDELNKRAGLYGQKMA